MPTDHFNSLLKQLRALPVRYFQTDSRNIQPGDVFVARIGQTDDSRLYAEASVQAGAIAIISNAPVETTVPNIVTPSFAASCSLISQFYQHPQDRLFHIGITGTNGKTTVAKGIQQLLNPTHPTGYTGTLGNDYRHIENALVNTTPDLVTLLNLCHDMVQAGITHHVMEVSSHALDQERVSMLDFDAIVITNLGEDHLDYHRTVDNYQQAKLRLIDRLKPNGVAIINGDDPLASVMIARARSKGRIITFSKAHRKADINASVLHSDLGGTEFTLNTQGKTFHAKTPLPFMYNLENSLAMLATVSVILKDMGEAIERLKNLPHIAGRSEVLALSDHRWAVVDYAHNQESLTHLLSNLRKYVHGRIFTVFGVTGDRIEDATAISAAACELSDYCIFTLDNPLGVEPDTIFQHMKAGAGDTPFEIISERETAIKAALNKLQPGDVLACCGKGPETWQYLSADKTCPDFYMSDLSAIQLNINN